MVKVISVPKSERQIAAEHGRREVVMQGQWICGQCNTVVEVDNGDVYLIGDLDMGIRMWCPTCKKGAWFKRTKEWEDKMAKVEARDGWYECTNCDQPILIATMDDVRKYDMRVRVSEEKKPKYTARCPNCWKPGMVNHPVIRRAGFFRTVQLVWRDVMDVVKGR